MKIGIRVQFATHFLSQTEFCPTVSRPARSVRGLRSLHRKKEKKKAKRKRRNLAVLRWVDGCRRGVGELLTGVVRRRRPDLVNVESGAEGTVLASVEVPHTDL